MTTSHSSGGWLVAVTREGGEKVLYHAAIADSQQAVARVLHLAGSGTGDAVSRLSHGQIESLGMAEGEVRFVR